MKKKFLDLIIAASSVASYADVSLYGRVAVGLENDSFPDTNVASGGSVQDFGSYFGIRGTDQVYGKTAAIWQIEQFLDISSGQAYYNSTGGGTMSPSPGTAIGAGHVNNETNTLASSESYLGLQGIWGRIRAGNLSNYMRSTMGAVDTFNYANGTNGLGSYSRSSKLLSTSFRYDSPLWNGFSFSGLYSFQNNNSIGAASVTGNNNFGGGANGIYSEGIWSIGTGWVANNFSVKLGTMVTEQVGSYFTGTNSAFTPNGVTPYANAYINRLELGYEDPEGAIVGVGFQTSSGQGWSSWANSGGSMNNYVTNPGYNVRGLNTNQYQTQELAASFGWHIGPWTPKLGYAYGNNLMYNGNVFSVATGTADQIANSGYQQAVAELDWNITPKTIVFLNYGQQLWDSTLQNVSYCGLNCNTSTPPVVNANNQAVMNQASAAIGFTHTF